MGGKNSAPKPPDYTPLANASEKSAQYSYQLAQRQQDWAEKVYNENKGTSDEVVNKAIAALDVQTQDAADARARYKTTFQPLEDQLVNDANTYNTPQKQETEAGKAEADVAAQFNSARQSAQDRLESYGVDPSQTRSGALDLGTRVAQAAAQSSAGNQARTQVENTGRALRAQAIDIGKGLPAQISNSQAGAGNSGNQAVNTNLATTASGAQTMGTGAGWQGLGNQAIGTWGDVLNNGYNNQLNQFKANQSSSSGWGSALGAIGGIAMSFADGGVIPDPSTGGVLPASASPSGGAVTDDIPAQAGALPVNLNSGEFIVPKDVTSWMGEKALQNLVVKSRKDMQGGADRPAQPTSGPPVPPEGVGAIPMRGQ